VPKISEDPAAPAARHGPGGCYEGACDRAAEGFSVKKRAVGPKHWPACRLPSVRSARRRRPAQTRTGRHRRSTEISRARGACRRAEAGEREAAPACWGKQTGAGCSSSELGGAARAAAPEATGGNGPDADHHGTHDPPTPATVPAMTSLRPPRGASQPPATPTPRSRPARSPTRPARRHRSRRSPSLPRGDRHRGRCGSTHVRAPAARRRPLAVPRTLAELACAISPPTRRLATVRMQDAGWQRDRC